MKDWVTFLGRTVHVREEEAGKMLNYM